MPAPIPAVPSLAGTTLGFQWLALDPGGPNGLFSLTGGMAVTILP